MELLWYHLNLSPSIADTHSWWGAILAHPATQGDRNTQLVRSHLGSLFTRADSMESILEHVVVDSLNFLDELKERWPLYIWWYLRTEMPYHFGLWCMKVRASQCVKALLGASPMHLDLQSRVYLAMLRCHHHSSLLVSQTFPSLKSKPWLQFFRSSFKVLIFHKEIQKNFKVSEL